MSKIELKVWYDEETKSLTYTTGDGKPFSLETGMPVEARKSQPEEVILPSDIPTLTLEEDKYVLNDLAISALEARPGLDKLVIREIVADDPLPVPAIAKNSAWNLSSGNILRKNCTVSYKGKQREILEPKGHAFELVPFGAGFFILKSLETQEEPLEPCDEVAVPENVYEGLDEYYSEASDTLDSFAVSHDFMTAELESNDIEELLA